MNRHIEHVWGDVRHGARLLGKSRGTSAIAIVALSLGIGLTAMMFSIVYGVVFRGLPFHDAERIMHVGHTNLPLGQDGLGVGIHDYLEYQSQQRSFEELAAFYDRNVSVSGTERAEWFSGAYVSPNTFDVLGVSPVRGRVFRAEEAAPSAEPVVIIGHALWQNRYAGDAQIVGKAIRVNGRAATVIGVMPADFRFPGSQQIWLPLAIDPVATPRGEGPQLEVFGRLREDTSADDAMRDLTVIAQRTELAHPATNRDLRPLISPYTDRAIGEEPRALLLTMLGAVFFVLLIACTNVANLLLSRALLRHKEVGIRCALGASRGRVVAQFLTEALVLCTIGSAAGTALAFAGIQVFNASLEPSRTPFWIVIQLDGIALAFVCALTVVTTIVAGAIPALQAARSSVGAVLGDESRGASSFRLGRVSRSLVVFEIALSCGLLVAAGLTTKSIVRLRNVDLGFDAEGLFTALVSLPEAYPEAGLPVFYARLNEQLAGVGELSAFTLSTSLPGLGDGTERIALDGQRYQREQDQPEVMRVVIQPGYLETLGVTPVEGRDFTAQDRAGSMPVALVNRGFARKYFPGEQALGKRIRLGTLASPGEWRTIVGIVPDLRFGELAGGNESESLFLPLAQEPQRTFWIIGRTRGEPLSVTGDVRSAVTAVDRDLPISFVDTLRGAIALDTWFYRVFGGVFMIFGAAALLLAAIGLYGVMAFSVSQRTRELGIRMAIGARPGDVVAMILRQGVAQVAVGLVVGLAIAAGVSRLLSIILFDVPARDPVIFSGVVIVLILTAVLACLVPARRATAVDPLQALRAE